MPRRTATEGAAGGQLPAAASGAAGELSLRGIARELNLVSSALYRYFPSREDLITALIVDACGDLADTLEAAGAADRRGPRRRWVAASLALRDWAVAQPHRFALVYGSAIPGYTAPPETIEPAGRVVRALCAPALEGADSGLPAPRGLLGQRLDRAAEGLSLDVGRQRMLALYASLVEQEADALGL